MKKIISLLLVVLPLLIMLSCDRNNPTSINPSSNSDGSNQSPQPTLSVELIIVQHYNQGGDYTLIDQKYTVTFPFLNYFDIWRNFTTLGNENGREDCVYTAYCIYSWTDYGWTVPYALKGSFELPNEWVLVEPICPSDPNNSDYHPPCSGTNSITVQLGLQKSTTYQYRLGFEGLSEEK